MARRLTCLVLAASLISACAPQEDTADTGDEGAGETAAKASATGKPAPDTLIETAWRIRAEDGARYVTMFDADGTYRDLRNGDPWQQGTWDYADGPEGKQVCFVPEGENAVEQCWLPGRIKDGVMIATGPAERRIELERVTYRPAEPEEGDAQE